MHLTTITMRNQFTPQLLPDVAIQQQAKRMLTRSTRSMRAVEEGGNVSVPVPTFDCRDPPNIIGMVVEIKGTKYMIMTS